MAITISGTGNGKINNTSFSTTTGNAVTTGDSGTVTETMLSSDFIEEGTWTPSFGGTNASTGQSYSDNTGYYKKVGPLVLVQCRVTLTNKGTMSGGSGALIRGLPFTHGTGTGRSGNFSFNSWNNITNATHSLKSYVASGGHIQLTDDDLAFVVALTAITNTSGVDVSGIYYTDE